MKSRTFVPHTFKVLLKKPLFPLISISIYHWRCDLPYTELPLGPRTRLLGLSEQGRLAGPIQITYATCVHVANAHARLLRLMVACNTMIEALRTSAGPLCRALRTLLLSSLFCDWVDSHRSGRCRLCRLIGHLQW